MADVVAKLREYQVRHQAKIRIRKRTAKALNLPQMSPKELLWFKCGAERAKDRKVLAAIDFEMQRRIKSMPWPPAA